jgi:hypothetical protein
MYGVEIIMLLFADVALVDLRATVTKTEDTKQLTSPSRLVAVMNRSRYC